MQLTIEHSLRMTIHAIKPFKVATGGGEKLIYDKMCKSMEIKIQGVKVRMDIFLIPLSSSNVVTDIQWLKKLGSIVFN